MEKYESTRLFILFLILFSPTILSKAIDHEEKYDQNRVANTVSKSWAKIKSILHATQMKYYPPDLNFRSQEKIITEDGNEGGSRTAEKVNKRVKLAVEKSLEDGEMTMEETAQTAAKLMGEAMHKAKDKVEHKLSKAKQDDEL